MGRTPRTVTPVTPSHAPSGHSLLRCRRHFGSHAGGSPVSAGGRHRVRCLFPQYSTRWTRPLLWPWAAQQLSRPGSAEGRSSRGGSRSSSEPVGAAKDGATTTTTTTAAMGSRKGPFNAVFESFESLGGSPPELQEPEAAVLLLAVGIGCATGAAVVLFNWSVHEIRDVASDLLQAPVQPGEFRSLPEFSSWPQFVALPVLGSAAVGAIRVAMDWLDRGGVLSGGGAGPYAQQQQRAKEGGGDGAGAGGGGEASASEELPPPRQEPLQLPAPVRAVAGPVLKAAAAAVTLGTGNSLGPEGPSVELGRNTARGMGGLLRSRERHLTTLLATGSAAGVAAGFNAPISGVFFAIETVLAKRNRSDFLFDEEDEEDNGLLVAALLLASVTAAVVSRAGLGSTPAFSVPVYQLNSLYELPLYCLLGGVCGVAAVAFFAFSRAVGSWFDDRRDAAEGPLEREGLMPLAGGAATALLALAYPEIMYQGFENVDRLLRLDYEYGAGLLMQIVVAKVLATGISKASGLVGGLYAPSIFLGAALGSAFADVGTDLVHMVSPDFVLSAPQAFGLVGVASMLAAICQVPLTSVLLLFELTQDVLIIVPALAGVGISYWLSLLLNRRLLAGGKKQRVGEVPAALPPPLFLQQQQQSPFLSGDALPPALAPPSGLVSGINVLPNATVLSNAAAAAAAAANADVLSNAAAEAAGPLSPNEARSDVAAQLQPIDLFLCQRLVDGSFSQAGLGPWSRDSTLESAQQQQQQQSLGSVAAAAGCMVLPAGMPVSSALQLLQDGGAAAEARGAVVCSADGRVVGIITLQSLVEYLALVSATTGSAAAAANATTTSDDDASSTSSTAA